MVINRPAPSKKDLRVEYLASQQSAEHHDKLVWQVSSIMWATNSLLIGFSLQGIHDKIPRYLTTFIAILGIVIVIGVWIFSSQLRDLKRQKYDHCKEIEGKLGLTQHGQTRYPAGAQAYLYGFIMIIFIIVWLAILYTVWCHCGSHYVDFSESRCR